LEYHLSGEFFSIPASLSERLSECYRGLRLWLLGDLPLGSPRLEPALATLGLLLLSLSALRQAPLVVSRLLAWPLLIFLHFFFYQPWHPEAWSPAAACGSLVISLGLLGRGRLLPLRCGLAVLWIAVLAFLLGRDQQQGRRLSEEVQAFVEADSPSRTPLRELTRWLDVHLEPEAEILVTDRLLVSYFQLYTKRTPLVREYLGVPKEALRGTYHLTSLSLRFYTPQRTLAEIDAAILAGRPVYLLSTESGSSPTVELPWGGLLLSRLTTPLGVRAETPLTPPSRTLVHATDLLSNDLTLTAVTPINPSVYRLVLRNGERTFSAKWKPLGVEGSEVQEGFDGNNAPRCELAARRIDQFLSDGDPRRELVPEVVLRSFHRQVPCDRPCQGIPQLIGAGVPATFAAINDHLVLGALSLWIEDAERPQRFSGQLWSPQRFAQDPAYRRNFADLMTFLYLIAHGDANYADNFLYSEGPPPRAYSIDNGRSLDGIPFYTTEGDPDWQPLAQLTPQSLVAPALSRQTLHRVAALPRLTTPSITVSGCGDRSELWPHRQRTGLCPKPAQVCRTTAVKHSAAAEGQSPKLPDSQGRQRRAMAAAGSLGVGHQGTPNASGRPASASAYRQAAAVRLIAQQPLGDRFGDRFNAKGVGPDSSAARRRRDYRGTGSARAAAPERAAPDGSVAPVPSWCESGRRPCG
jgi:hypothetical protein